MFVLMNILWACAGPPSDREAYLSSLSGHPDKARAGCAGIGDTLLAGECYLQVAHTTARAGDRSQAESTCAATPEGPFKDECWFLITDLLDLLDEEAQINCGRAGRFRGNCLGHAYGRDVERTLGSAEGREADWLLEAQERVAFYLPKLGPRQRRDLGESMLVRQLQERWASGDFDASLCGNAPLRTCARAYRESAFVAQPGEGLELDRACSMPRDVVRIRAAGGRGWTAESEAMATGVWDELCGGGPR